MTLECGCFQKRHFATLPSGAALAITLIVQASPACGENIELFCTPTGSGEYSWPVSQMKNIRIVIDLDSRSVTEVRENGTKTFAATISDQFIRYGQVTTLDRTAGTMVELIRGTSATSEQEYRYACRRATQKF